ncbi:hypothetical protein C8J57DRAFT_1284085 [Mycena rebaudengoi]|nr:hypothetical protein C8J57DRAFT_1284085 [Mycena rebaudengoi]
MPSQDSILFNSSSGGSRLLSESPFLPSGSSLSSHTGPGGDDLSISELSLSNRTDLEDGDDGPVLPDPEEQERVKRHVGKLRDEKLQNDAFILKKLNASLASYKEVLGDVASQNERVAAQLQQTDALLNKYTSILSGSEDSKAEQLAAVQREQERAEREEQERIEQMERERIEQERKERTARGTVRGVRGTRASMRATGRTTRGAGPPSGRVSTSAAGTASSSAARGSSTARGLPRRTDKTS